MTKPKIGIIPDYKTSGYSNRPHYAIRANYLEMISKNEALPILIPYDYKNIDEYLKIIDGLLVIGGFFDIHPKKYNQDEIHETVVLNEVRENFEFKFVEKFLQTKKPILGICNGMQTINVLRGGDLIQHIPDFGNFLNHEQSKVAGKEDSSKAYHEVKIVDKTRLKEIVGEEKIMTNSSHHQAIKNAGNGLKINALASDGIIEGIEDENHPFCLGVQWHPEFAVSEADEKIFSAFIAKTKN